MIYQYINSSMTPRGGWFYLVEDVEGDAYTMIEAPNERSLFRKVADHYRFNRLPIPTKLRDSIKDQVCIRVGSSYCTAMSEGVGDTMHKIFKATGITAIAKKIVKNKGQSTCASCDKRQRDYNKRYPYQKKR